MGKLNYRFGIPIVLIIIGVISMTFVLAGYRSKGKDQLYTPEARIDLTEPTQDAGLTGSSQLPLGMQLRVAIAPVISAENSIEKYNRFVEYLGRKMNREPVMLRRQSYADVNELVRFQQCDLALVCTYAYIRGARDFGMELLAIPRINNKIHYYSFIVVPYSSNVSSLLDLRGMRFASADLMSTSGWLWPMAWLKENGQEGEDFFAEHLITGSHDNSVFALTSGLVDGAAVDSLVYEQMMAEDPELGENTKVIMRSPAFGMPPIVVPGQLDPEIKHELLEVLLQMHENVEGFDILTDLYIDRFEVGGDEIYASVRQVVNSWEGVD